MRHPFPLYKDSAVFKCKTKEMKELLSKNLIEHKQDDDYDTDLDVVDDHVEMCLNDLREAIEAFVSAEDPLKLCRNLRGEYSGIERLECKEDEEAEETPNSSWYEFVSIPSTSNNKDDGPPNDSSSQFSQSQAEISEEEEKEIRKLFQDPPDRRKRHGNRK